MEDRGPLLASRREAELVEADAETVKVEIKEEEDMKPPAKRQKMQSVTVKMKEEEGEVVTDHWRVERRLQSWLAEQKRLADTRKRLVEMNARVSKWNEKVAQTKREKVEMKEEVADLDVDSEVTMMTTNDDSDEDEYCQCAKCVAARILCAPAHAAALARLEAEEKQKREEKAKKEAKREADKWLCRLAGKYSQFLCKDYKNCIQIKRLKGIPGKLTIWQGKATNVWEKTPLRAFKFK